jgi:alpha-beta hydrolase superfamily lysophospholipase
MQGPVMIDLHGRTFAASIHAVEQIPQEHEKYQLVHIETSRGRIVCHYYEAPEAVAGVVMVGGIGGGFDTPAKGLYPKLCEDLQKMHIGSLRVQFRSPADLAEATIDTVAGVSFLQSLDIQSIGVMGHSLGGAVAIQAAAHSRAVKTIITLSTQGYGGEPVAALPQDTSILLIHGSDDWVLTPKSSEYVYQMAHEPKRLRIYQGTGHDLDEAAEQVYEEVKGWIIEQLT